MSEESNPILGYADSYRSMARQGTKSVDIWSVITDLERNMAPLMTTAQSQLAALREELAQWKHIVGAVGATIPLGKTLESLSTKQTMVDYFKALHAERDELQQRLADADRRNAIMTDVLNDVAIIAGEPAFSAYSSQDKILDIIRAALTKPEEAKS